MAEAKTLSQGQTSRNDKPLETRTRDALTEGLVELLKPAVEEIDQRVKNVRESQLELRQQIESLGDDLRKISEVDAMPLDLDPYVKKLNNSRRRVMLVNNILQNVQGFGTLCNMPERIFQSSTERLNKLHTNISKETARRKTMLDPPSPSMAK